MPGHFLLQEQSQVICQEKTTTWHIPIGLTKVCAVVNNVITLYTYFVWGF